MRFIVIVESGPGCDYSIKCGVEVVGPIETEHTLSDVMVEVKRALFDGTGEHPWERQYGLYPYGRDTENPLHKVTVVRLQGDVVVAPLDAWTADRETEKTQSDTAQRRAEYERLKAEFGE